MGKKLLAGQSQDNNLKWYQRMIKKFKNWNENRKNPKKALPEPKQDKPNIRDTWKVEIVRDAIGYDETVIGPKGKHMQGEHVYGIEEKRQLREARKQQRQNSDDGSR